MKTRHNPERKAFKGRSHKKGGELVEDLNQKLDEIVAKSATILEGVIKREKQYPMCTKLKVVRNDKAILLCFLEWMREEKKIWLCTEGSDGGNYEHFYPSLDSEEKLLMEYFGIDAVQLEKERQKILKEQRKLNKEKA